MHTSDVVVDQGQNGQLQTLAHRRLRYTLRVILRDPLAVFGVLIIILLIVLALFGPWIAPYPEQGKGRTNVPDRFQPPSGEYWLGTDQLGRDILSRVIIGSSIALRVPTIVVTLAVVVGAPLGALAGYVGGRLDNLIMRLTDLFLAFPSLLLALAIVAALGPSLTNAMLAIAISWWPWYTRLVRGVTLSLRERYFVEAARSIGVQVDCVFFIIFVPIIALLASHQLSIGGIGVQANSCVALFSSIWPEQADIVAFEFFAFLIGILSTIPGGIIFMFRKETTRTK